MKKETPLYPSLLPTSLTRLLFAALALLLTSMLFALLPVADAIRRPVSPLRLPAKPAIAAPLHVLRKKATVTESRPSPNASAVAQPRMPSPQSQRPIPALKLSRQIPNLAQVLPLTTHLSELGDISFDFVSEIPTAEEMASPTVPIKPFMVSDLDAPPRLLSTNRPPYPMLAKQRGIEGFVNIEFVINKDGTVGAVKVLHSNPTEVFDAAACKTATNWRFSIPKKNGVAVDVLARQQIQFKLEKQ